jgi:protein-disulfide isomerase
MNQESHEETKNSGGDGSNSFLASSILVAALIIGGSVIYATRANVPNSGEAGVPTNNAESGDAKIAREKALEITSRDVIAEDANAPVTIIEYGDYQCPFCVKFFNQTESLIRNDYIKTGKVKMIYRNFAFLGPESIAAAEAAECAKDQGKFWAYHDAIYKAEGVDGTEFNGNLNRELFVKLAGDTRMDTAKFAECFDGKKYEKTVEDEIAAAKVAGVDSTPSFFINGNQVKGAIPYSQFKTLIDAELAK